MNSSLNLLKSPAFIQDPYPIYQQLRAQGQPVWLPQPSGHLTSQGTWLFFNHDDISRLIQDTKSVSHEIAHHRTPGSENFYDLNMLLRDADDHQRLRKLVNELFSPKGLKDFSATILDMTHKQLDMLASKDAFDLMEDFASALPVRIMARILGTPEDDAAQIRAWTLDLHDMSDSLLDGASSSKRHVLGDLYRYVAKIYLDDANHRAGTVIAKLRQDELSGALSRDEALAMLTLLLVAGNATVTALVSTTMWLLLSHPAQLALLRANPTLLDATIEESLRFESPVQRTLFRITTDTIELDRYRLEKDQQISLVVASANRDETVFTAPDVFDIMRASKSHLAFGRGVHTCLGKHLAQMEARIILRAMLERMPDLQLVNTQSVWRQNSMFREQRELWVRAQ